MPGIVPQGRDNPVMPTTIPCAGHLAHPVPPPPWPAPPWLRVLLAAALPVLGACAPALDWREVRPANGHLLLSMPCKPSVQQRKVLLAGHAVVLSLHACTADDQTWALAFADLSDPARVGPALRELRASAAANLDASQVESLRLTVTGATPNPASERVALKGRLPNGKPVQEQVAVFAYGTRVYQATVIGAAVAAQAAENFLTSLRIVP